MNTWLVALVGAFLLAAPWEGTAGSCPALASLSLPHAKIDLAESVPAGDFSFDVKRQGTGPQQHRNLPAFCRLAATLTPSADSDIKIEIWMPTANWNGKLLAVGNGNWAGSIQYGAMAAGLRKGYATTSTDTGHAAVSTDGSWAYGHPEKVTDFGWRSVHEMTVAAKAVIAAFYGSAPRQSYWSGCSTGGRQGLMAAIRFADDFDGIIAGTPSNPRANRNGWQLQATIASRKAPLSDAKLELIHRAAVAACDALDGLKDGLIDDPRDCRFDPATLRCRGADTDSCLTQTQVETTKVMYSPGRFSSGEEYHPGLEPGSEIGWSALAGPDPSVQSAVNYSYLVHQNPNWDWRTFNPDTDVPLAQRRDAGTVDVTSTDFSAFVRGDGKLILCHGWSDPSVAPRGTLNYYRKVLDTTSGAADSIRLFMVPMMGHCGGGDGPNTFDMVAALDQWVDRGTPPAQVIASRIENGQVVRTRPLCPYPLVARYQGSGSIDDAANFACVKP